MDVILAAINDAFTWQALLAIVIGTWAGIIIGGLPGLGSVVGLTIFLPFTFGMEPGSAFAFLLGMFAVTTTSDTISSVLLGIPGTAASQATVLDGYPMAMRGEASRAFGAAFTVSALGGVIGAVFLAFSIPIVRPLILSFASPEFFLLGVLGLTMVGSLSGDSIVKGMIAAVLGLMLSMVGYAEMGAIARRDNHARNTRGLNLTCKVKLSIRASVDQQEVSVGQPQDGAITCARVHGYIDHLGQIQIAQLFGPMIRVEGESTNTLFASHEQVPGVWVIGDLQIHTCAALVLTSVLEVCGRWNYFNGCDLGAA